MTVVQVTMSAVVAQAIAMAPAGEAAGLSVVLTHFSQRTWLDLVRKATLWVVE